METPGVFCVCFEGSFFSIWRYVSRPFPVVGVFVSWLVLLSGLFLLACFLIIRARGSLRYWIRTFRVDRQWVVGRIYRATDKDGITQFFTDGNVVVRSLDRRINRVVRRWDRKERTVFISFSLSCSSMPHGIMRQGSRSSLIVMGGR